MSYANVPPGWRPVYLSPDVYAHLERNANNWGASIHTYTDRDIRRLIYEPATKHPFAFAAMIRLQRDAYNNSVHEYKKRKFE